ncbi:hypothetical protein PCANC_13549 [Puccinia coronata f. sp. avenae]|uniref:Uncharacterized protein n=1 Tax=Puccinia coronata f. sp. avenae TaxID=200324 RepID=A0A2N5UCP7_9BASI|nr:hypothetical protein PCANC_13549 [Puccinia coronata f. sp. avenae]
MFQAGVLMIWKLWLISATVILGIQAIVDLSGTSGRAKLVVRRAEVGNKALHRRANQAPISAQCVNSYNYQDPKKYPLKKGTVACMAAGPAGKRPMVCSGKCEIRSNENFELQAPIPFGDFGYKDCGRDFGNFQNEFVGFTVHPKQFRAFNDQNIIYVQGWHDPNDQTTRLYDCSWMNPGATNNQRPWCDGCVDHFFEELPIKE